jgi:hypothetical protein
MTRQHSPMIRILGASVLFAALTFLIAFAVPAQQAGTSRPSAKPSAVRMAVQAGTPAKALLNPLPPGAISAQRASGVSLQNKNVRVDPMDSGNPLFLPAVTYGSGGSPPMSVAVADLNGDGKPDLVVANFCAAAGNCLGNAGVVGVLLGNGDGTFLTAVTYGSGGEVATSVAIADVNGDHIPDLVVANCGPTGVDGCQTATAVVGVLLGNGDGTFGPVAVYESGGSGAYSVAVADVNGDGKPDLVVANIGGSIDPDIGVLLGNGNGTFQPALTYEPGGGGSYSVAVADVNGDGKPDLLVGNACANPEQCTGSSVGVLLGNGDGTFQPVAVYDSGGASYTSVAVADLNRDGKLDLIVATADATGGSDQGSVSVLIGNGDGTFQSAVKYDSGGIGAWALAVADMDGDGKLDVIVTNIFDSTVALLLGNGDGTLQAAVTYDSGGSSPDSVAIADVNGDSLPDIVLAECPLTGCGSDGEAGVLLHVGTKPTTTLLTSTPNPSFFGQLVTFSAAVSSASGTPTGSVRFFDNSTALGSANMVNGNASISISTLAAGSHPITAVYQGSLTFSASSSLPLQQTVNHATVTTVTSLVSSVNPSIYSQAVTFTATVSSVAGVPPNGETVTFLKNSTVLGTAALNSGVASLTTSSLPAGLLTITAVYGGDANFTASTSPALQQAVDTKTQFATATTFASSLNPSIYRQKVTWTATVTTSGPNAPTGKVKFSWQQHSIGIVAVNASGVATLSRSDLNVGFYPLSAFYLGDANNGPSASLILNQVITQATTSATLTSSPNPSTSGQAVTFTATITSPTATPTGPVTFAAGKTALGTAQLNQGKAKFTTTTLAVGTTTVTATYAGDSNIAKSSASVTQTVH